MSSLNSPLKQRMQSFLTANGVPPGADLSGNSRQIFALLQRRRSDDAFWAPLVELLRDLVNSVVQGKVAEVTSRPEVRLLAMWDVRELATLLREALNQSPALVPIGCGGAERERHRGFMRGLPTNTLGLFLLLSLAASACSSSDTKPTTGWGDAGSSGGTGNAGSGGTGNAGGSGGTGGTTGFQLSTSTTCQRDVGTVVTSDAGAALPDKCCADTASQLWKAIDDSSLSATDKQALYTCFANLNANWCDGLVDMFKTQSATKIAEYLENLLGLCSSDPSQVNGTFSKCIVDRLLCSVVLYKGVAFPR